MDFFKRLDKKYYHTEPVEYIYGLIVRTVAEYDDLYENQRRFDGKVWTEFKEMHDLTCQFHEDIRDIDYSKEVICLWFFRERSDRDPGNDIKLAGKIINYSPNALFITQSKEIKIKERKNFFPRRPCVQINLKQEKVNEIVNRFK